jgi:hypothetical protein
MVAFRVRGPTRQLSLFPARRKKPVPAPEFSVHCVIADVARRWITPGWEWTHLPFGEYRPPKTAGKLKRMGVRPGWPDFLFVSPEGRHHYLEIKREGGVKSGDQERLAQFFLTAGVPYLLSSKVDEMVATLRLWGAILPQARMVIDA